MNTDPFDLFCPKCNILVATKVIGSSSNTFVESADYYDIYYISQCGRCSQVFLIKRSIYSLEIDEIIKDEAVLYPMEGRVTLENLPDKVKSAYEEACKTFSATAYGSCVVMCRISLEVICNIHKTKGENLYKRLESLKNEGIIDKRLLDWSHEIRSIGNDVAHDAVSEVRIDDARDCLDLTEAILIYVFSLGARFKKLKNRRKKQGENS